MRISGIVRITRSAESRLRTGVPPDERPQFLTVIRRRLAEIHELLIQGGARPADLPTPSRRALESLTRIASMTEEEVAALATEPDRPPPVRIRNVLRSLRLCEELLAFGGSQEHAVQETRVVARVAAEGVQDACERAGSTPTGLPERSRSAYAMLRWLAEGDHAALYAAQVDAALRGLVTGLPEKERTSHRPRAIVFAPGRLLYKVTRVANGLSWRLSAGFLAADRQDFEDLAVYARRRRGTPREIRERHEAFARSEAFSRVPLELAWLADPQPFRPQGRAYDLEALFGGLDRTLLRGRLERPNLHWWSTLSRHTFGFHLPLRDLVCINAILDDPAIPEFVAEVVLHHECLHKLHEPRVVGGRRIVHTNAFRAAEREHPRFAEADAWLRRLARGGHAPAE